LLTKCRIDVGKRAIGCLEDLETIGTVLLDRCLETHIGDGVQNQEQGPQYM
jgi:hypothetical protein